MTLRCLQRRRGKGRERRLPTTQWVEHPGTHSCRHTHTHYSHTPAFPACDMFVPSLPVLLSVCPVFCLSISTSLCLSFCISLLSAFHLVSISFYILFPMSCRLPCPFHFSFVACTNTVPSFTTNEQSILSFLSHFFYIHVLSKRASQLPPGSLLDSITNIFG